MALALYWDHRGANGSLFFAISSDWNSTSSPKLDQVHVLHAVITLLPKCPVVQRTDMHLNLVSNGSWWTTLSLLLFSTLLLNRLHFCRKRGQGLNWCRSWKRRKLLQWSHMCPYTLYISLPSHSCRVPSFILRPWVSVSVKCHPCCPCLIVLQVPPNETCWEVELLHYNWP